MKIHSGIKSLFINKIPLIKNIISGTEEHDLHHSRIKGNYASTFKFWDWLCGTQDIM